MARKASKGIGSDPLRKSIRAWYRQAYPTDDMGEELHPRVTFLQLAKALYDGKDVYWAIGAEDSLIRERVFAELARIDGCDYDVVYDMWMHPDRHNPVLAERYALHRKRMQERHARRVAEQERRAQATGA